MLNLLKGIRQSRWSMLIAAGTVFVVLGGSATAARVFTGRDVANGSLTGADIKDHSIKANDVAAGVAGSKGDRGETGSQGAAGSNGATGPAGPQGPQGSMGPVGITQVRWIGEVTFDGTNCALTKDNEGNYHEDNVLGADYPVTVAGLDSKNGCSITLSDSLTDAKTTWGTATPEPIGKKSAVTALLEFDAGSQPPKFRVLLNDLGGDTAAGKANVVLYNSDMKQ